MAMASQPLDPPFDGKVVLTGGAGRVASLIRPRLRSLYRTVVLTDVTAVHDLADNEEFRHVDLRDAARMAEACESAALVVHLGGLSGEAEWSDICAVNIDGTRSVLEACRQQRIDRVILASSNHAVGMKTVQDVAVDAASPSPDTYYGVSKAAGEALGALYASRFGILAVSVRIGTLQKRPTSIRALSTWMSPDDFIRLIVAVQATDETGHHIVWGVSRNTRGVFPPDAGERLGFVAEDDAEDYADDVTETSPFGAASRIGGAMTADDYSVWGR